MEAETTTTLEAPPIAEGDTVQLISGGPVMLVTRLAEGGSREVTGEDTCDVAYHDNHGVFQREKNLQVRWLQRASVTVSIPYNMSASPNEWPFNKPQFFTSEPFQAGTPPAGFPTTAVVATAADGEE